jgi:hypothetical protein
MNRLDQWLYELDIAIRGWLSCRIESVKGRWQMFGLKRDKFHSANLIINTLLVYYVIKWLVEQGYVDLLLEFLF